MDAALFRFRGWIMTSLIILGFWAPWARYLSIGSTVSLLEWLALETSRTGLLSFTAAAPVVILCGSVFAALGAMLRIWGAAFLGAPTVKDSHMQAGAVVADGPYRYVRNPLYLGVILWVAALSLLMPASGAAFAVITVPLFTLALIHGEERFLASQSGAAYQAYLQAVPRLMPRLRTTIARGDNKPRWGQAILSELFPIGIFVTVAGLSWTYNNSLMIRAILISYGVSMIARALMPSLSKGPAAAQ